MNLVATSDFEAITGSQELQSGKGTVYGFIVSSHTSGTLKLWDNTAGSGRVIMHTFTHPSGSGMYKLPFPVNFETGLFDDMNTESSVFS